MTTVATEALGDLVPETVLRPHAEQEFAGQLATLRRGRRPGRPQDGRYPVGGDRPACWAGRPPTAPRSRRSTSAPAASSRSPWPRWPRTGRLSAARCAGHG